MKRVPLRTHVRACLALVLLVPVLACDGPEDGSAHEEIVGATHRFADVGPTRWHYLESGSGEPVVFLHGMPETSYAWRRQFNWLAADYRVIAVDLEGFGSTRTEAEDFSVGAMAGRLLALLDAIGIDEFHLVGHDWGGLIGARAASRAAGRVLSYTHVSAPLRRYDLTRNPDYRDFYNNPDSVPDLLRNPEIFVSRCYEIGVAGGPLTLSPTLLERYTVGLSTKAALDAIAAYFSQLDIGADWTLGPRSAPSWASIEAPVLFVVGGRDLMLPLEEYHEIESIVPTLERLVVLEGTGHYPHEEDPGEFGVVLLEFLQSR
jgi:pimeloyl-ACP methyl ester carboxylesterase